MKAEQELIARAWQTFRWPIAAFILIHVVGTAGFWVISKGSASLIDCLYMVFITVASIGYGEIIDLSQSPGGRVFNMAIAFLGIGTLGVMMSKLTVFIVEGRFDEVLRRRKMQDRIDHLREHFVVCGVGRVGTNVVHELHITERDLIALDESADALAAFRERYPEALTLHGDASDDELLERAGVKRAKGLFAITGDDGKNLLITLSAKQLNPNVRVVARCHEVRNIDKLKRIGADAIVSPDFTGGMRIASSMLRPVVVSFLDEMLRTDQGLRVEEIVLPQGAPERRIGELAPADNDYVVLAVRSDGQWEFNPSTERTAKPGATLVVMTTPAGRMKIERRVAAA